LFDATELGACEKEYVGLEDNVGFAERNDIMLITSVRDRLWVCGIYGVTASKG
jgi:limonene-1,2-epoxide hydrolase